MSTQPSRVEGNQEFHGNVTFMAQVAMATDGQISDDNIAASANIAASKLEHQFPVRYVQASNVTAYDHTEVVHAVYGVTGTVVAIEAGCIDPCTGTAEIDVDLLVGGTSILSSAITLDSSNTARVGESGGIATAAVANGNVIEVSVKAKGPDTGNFEYVEEFLGDAGDTLPGIWGTNGQTANSTEDYVTDSGCGIFQLATDGTSEAQATQLTSNDNLWIDLYEKPIIEWRVNMNLSAASVMTANDRLVMGVCSAHANAEDDLDAVTINAWFRMDGTSANITLEADDGTIDESPQDSTIDHVDSAWMHFKLDFADLSDVKFYINGTEQGGATVSMANIVSTTLVQPIFCIQRDDADADIHIMNIDQVKVTSGRTAGTMGKGVYCVVILQEKAA